jgi:hypothetical protein
LSGVVKNQGWIWLGARPSPESYFSKKHTQLLARIFPAEVMACRCSIEDVLDPTE